MEVNAFKDVAGGGRKPTLTEAKAKTDTGTVIVRDLTARLSRTADIKIANFLFFLRSRSETKSTIQFSQKLTVKAVAAIADHAHCDTTNR